MKNSIPIIVGAESETGRRQENQDHMTGFTCGFGAVYAIADGMGGHRGGAEASRMVTKGVRAHLLAASSDMSLTEAITQAVRLTNEEIFAKSNSGDPNSAGMGSTLSLVVISEENGGAQVVAAHVGDSRVYLERNDRLTLLTKDHTYVQRLLDSNAIDEETARTHPEASVLTRAMGQASDVAVDISAPIALSDADGILLCSDGLSAFAKHALIEDTVRQNPGPSQCAKALIKLALESGSDDNVTVQFVRFGSNPAPSPPPKRTTRPEAETVAKQHPARGEDTVRLRAIDLSPRRDRRRLYAILAFALLLVAAGIYKFRHSLFPAAPVPAPAPAPATTTPKKARRRPSPKEPTVPLIPPLFENR